MPSHQDLTNAIRAQAMDAVERAKSGHPGMPMGMAGAATVLFTLWRLCTSSLVLASSPHWPDRFMCSGPLGHGSLALPHRLPG